jgi:hypothetical protein
LGNFGVAIAAPWITNAPTSGLKQFLVKKLLSSLGWLRVSSSQVILHLQVNKRLF